MKSRTTFIISVFFSLKHDGNRHSGDLIHTTRQRAVEPRSATNKTINISALLYANKLYERAAIRVRKRTVLPFRRIMISERARTRYFSRACTIRIFFHLPRCTR